MPDTSHDGPTPDPLRSLELFAYTVYDGAPVYRAVMRIFLEAKERYRVQLRPDEIAASLVRRLPEPPDRPALERALDQLHSWGNLRRSHDTGRVATLEDFRRRHDIYRMTPAGEAAERAVGRVLEALESSGSLQRVMLRAILGSLESLAAEARREEPRPDPLYEHLFNLAEQFRALTENASTFLARLHEAIDAGEVDATAFLVYKQAVLEYLEGFVGELSELAPQIARRIREIEERGAPALVALAAEADTTPTPEGRRDRSTELAWQWEGIVDWFLGRGTELPTVEELRGAARQAINRILLVLERLHEKRFRRVNRTADLLRLAGWFDRLSREGAVAPDPGSGTDPVEEAHRLFATAFGLYGARHLGLLHEDSETASPGASWWRAPPVPVAPMLRRSGRTSVLGRTARVVDHSEARRYLAERHRRERAAREAALARFADRGPLALADLPPLSRDELDLLLALLDQLLASPPGPAGVRQTRSRDGLLELVLERPERDGTRAMVAALHGRLELPAWVLTVSTRATAREARG